MDATSAAWLCWTEDAAGLTYLTYLTTVGIVSVVDPRIGCDVTGSASEVALSPLRLRLY